jgi:hypothetical protein
MQTIKRHLVINQGATYSNTITIYHSNGSIANTSGWSANASFRGHYAATNSTAFDCSLNSNGSLTMSLTANVTANTPASRYVYDIKLTTNSNTVIRYQEGYITVPPAVTR